MSAVEVSHSAERREALVRRTTLVLAAAQALLWGSLGVFAAFGPIVGPRLGGAEREAGILFGLYYLGSAAGARVAGRAMDRFGRRVGLAGGYVVMAAAGVVAAVGGLAGSVNWLRSAFAVMGLGVGATLLGRAAVADLYPPERRGRAVGTVVMAGAIGAIGGPPLGAVVHGAARGLGVPSDASPWILASLLAVMALMLVMTLRPDPRELAVGSSAASGRRRRPYEILVSRGALVPVVTVAVAQAVMVTFMSVIPAVLGRHGAGELTVSLVVSGHLGAMFLFSPLLGAILDTVGRRAGLLAGVALLGVGVVVGMLGTGPVPGGGGLLLIGVGWSAAYLASTAAISDLTAPDERASALGATDLVAGLSAAVGVLGGALLLAATSFEVLAVAGLGLLLGPLAMLAAARTGPPSPGRVPP